MGGSYRGKRGSGAGIYFGKVQAARRSLRIRDNNKTKEILYL